MMRQKLRRMFKNMSETSLVNTKHHRRMKKNVIPQRKQTAVWWNIHLFIKRRTFFVQLLCVCPQRDRQLKMPLQMLSLSLKADWTLTDGRPLTLPGSLALFVFRSSSRTIKDSHASQHLLIHLCQSFKSSTDLSTSLIIASCLQTLFCLMMNEKKRERQHLYETKCGWAETGRLKGGDTRLRGRAVTDGQQDHCTLSDSLGAT